MLTSMNSKTRFLVFLMLVIACISLYYPWRNNPLVFDDSNILKSTALFDYAQTPFSLLPRQFPYFTLGFENLMSGGDIHISRYVNIALHALNAFLLFLLSHQLLTRFASRKRACITATALGMVFVVHPTAVYAVGYLVQRTTLFATLFLLLSALLLDQALVKRSAPRAILAGACYGLAVFSKEHALTGLLGVLGIVLTNPSIRGTERYKIVLAFLLTALPAALWVASLKLGFVGAAYEPDAHELISAAGFPDAGSRLGNWALSAALQCLFFFRYWAFWWWPNPSGMAIDIRPDFNLLSHFPWVAVGPLGFAVLVGAVTYIALSNTRKPALNLVAYGLLWAMGLFLVELSTVRFQEPVVLYRSYLWAPGFLLALAGLASLIPARVASAVGIAAVLVLFPLAWGRLGQFSSELALWQEAGQKLPQATAPGAIRIHYNIAAFQAGAGHLDAALQDYEWVISHEPGLFQGYWGRSSVHLAKNQLAEAQTDLETVIRLKPDFGMAYFQLGALFKRLGKPVESEAAFSQAEKHGIARIHYE
jgi:tetratricopeptide (TPR) repeat protein